MKKRIFADKYITHEIIGVYTKVLNRRGLRAISERKARRERAKMHGLRMREDVLGQV